MNNIVPILTRHGFKIMMVGFALTLSSLLFFIAYVKNLDAQNTLRQLSFGVTIAGFGIWIFGRIFVQLQRKADRLERMRRKAQAEAEAEEKEEEESTAGKQS